MSRKEKKAKNREFISTRQEIREAARIQPKDLVGGRLLSREGVIRQIPFALFLFLILLIYIANQYRGQRIMRETMALEEEVKLLRAKAVTTTFQLQEMSKQSTVVDLIEEQGISLEEALIPPYKIVIDE